MSRYFFEDWDQIGRTLVIGVLAYVCLVVLLRMSGNRTLTKMNAFDLVVTVALGSTLATILLSKDVALAEGVTALALLIGLQFVVTWSSVRIPWVRRVVTGEPFLLAYQGRMLQKGLKQQRVAEDEVLAAIRATGLRGLGDVEAVVLETDGSISVVHQGSGAGVPSLNTVQTTEEDAKGPPH